MQGGALKVVGAAHDGEDAFAVPPDSLRAFRVLVSAPPTAVTDGSAEFRFVVIDVATGEKARHDTVFRGPAR